jgi:hypothetical protein
MAYSNYAIQRKYEMTLHAIVGLIVVGAVVLAAAATRFDVSPSRIFGLAGLATLVTVVLAMHYAVGHCSFSDTGPAERFFGIMVVSSLTLCVAAALRGFVDGIRLGKAGDSEAAIVRCVGCPIAGALGVGIVFFAFLYAIGPCLD